MEIVEGWKGDLLVEDRSEDGEAGHTEDCNQDSLATVRKVSLSDHGQRHQNQAKVGGNVEAHLQD